MFLSALTNSDIISICALIVAVIAIIPGSISLHKQRVKIKVAHVEASRSDWAEKFATIYYDLTLCNVSSEPITVHHVHLKVNQSVFEYKLKNHIQLHPHDAQKTTFKFQIPKDTIIKKPKLILNTSVKNIVIKRLPTPIQNDTYNNIC